MVRGGNKGFTLIEVLVVLVLLGMITTLLMEGFGFVLQLRMRFLDQLDRQRSGRLEEYWFRSVCGGIMPDHTEGQHKFSGDAAMLQGLSLGALSGGHGAPRAVRLELIREEGWWILQYQEPPAEPWRLTRWRCEEAHFRYLDYEGQWHDQWPPRRGEEAPQAPAGILLAVKEENRPVSWFVERATRSQPKPTLEDLLKRI